MVCVNSPQSEKLTLTSFGKTESSETSDSRLVTINEIWVTMALQYFIYSSYEPSASPAFHM